MWPKLSHYTEINPMTDFEIDWLRDWWPKNSPHNWPVTRKCFDLWRNHDYMINKVAPGQNHVIEKNSVIVCGAFLVTIHNRKNACHNNQNDTYDKHKSNALEINIHGLVIPISGESYCPFDQVLGWRVLNFTRHDPHAERNTGLTLVQFSSNVNSLVGINFLD